MQSMGRPALSLETLMKALTIDSAWHRSSGWARSLAMVSLAAGAWALSAGSAHARGGNDIYWSIGVNQPGVSVGVSNAPPVVYRQRPQVVVVERPVIYERPVVYQRPVVVYQTRPYVVAQPVVVYRERGYRRIDDRRGYKRDKWNDRQERRDSRRDRHHDRWHD
jgi:hypothetical protein